MRKITSVSVGEQLDSFITRMVQSGRYGSASEVMRSALRLLEQQESRDEAVRNAVIEGLESGESSMTLRDIAAERKQKTSCISLAEKLLKISEGSMTTRWESLVRSRRIAIPTLSAFFWIHSLKCPR